MTKQYVTKPIKCSRCKGTGLEYTGMYATDCLMCNGKGERLVTLPVEEWAKEENNEQPRRD